jgi:hypothetical protein|tara:strand:+ start:409 stop:813 length:405 start_codon:yes stop_codon:yes gene_type:complete
MTLHLTNDQIDRFNTDGFLIVKDLVDSKTIVQLRERFDCLFQGDFHSGIKPDEVNWQEGKSDPKLTRQICNAWKADPWVAATVLGEDLGKALAQLGRYKHLIDFEMDESYFPILWQQQGHRTAGLEVIMSAAAG